MNTARVPSLEGKTVMITGASAGIGFAVAGHALQEGASVILVGRDPSSLESRADELGCRGRVDSFTADVSTNQGALSLAARLTQCHGGRLDGLVLAHGSTASPEPFDSADANTFGELADQMFVTNARTIHALVPSLRQARGSIVQITSEAGRFTTPGEAVIGALAAANMMLIRTLAKELGRTGIRANAVALTITSGTPSHERMLGGTAFTRRLFEKAIANMPLGEVTPDDVAATVRYLLSEESSKVTGQILGVTAGLAT